MIEPPIVLTIAGSDCSGGAGIQADIKTFSAMGVYGASVITALTAQNTIGVAGIQAASPEFVALQLTGVLDDLKVAAAKTGMLLSTPIIEAVAGVLKKRSQPLPLVVDPVCMAQTGAALLKPDAIESLKEKIIPLASLLTPNRPEAETLSGMKIHNEEDVARAGRKLLDLGAKAVLVKGGHMPESGPDRDKVTDWLILPDQPPESLAMPRVATRSLHGTGCILSAAITAGLAKGLELREAIRKAQAFLNLALERAFPVGKGNGPPNLLVSLADR